MQEESLVYPYPRPYMCAHPPLQINQDPLLRDSAAPPMTLQRAYDILDFQMFMLQNPHLISDLEWHELDSINERMESRIRLNESKTWEALKNAKKKATEAASKTWNKIKGWSSQDKTPQNTPPPPFNPYIWPQQSAPTPGYDQHTYQPSQPPYPPPGYVPSSYQQPPQGYTIPQGYAPQQQQTNPQQPPQAPNPPINTPPPPPQPYAQRNVMYTIPEEGIVLMPMHAQRDYPQPSAPDSVNGLNSPFHTVLDRGQGRR